jgi:peptidoglycan/LPS O-acetylase OafA/YrhL
LSTVLSKTVTPDERGAPRAGASLERNSQLDLLRALAIAMVVGYHLIQTSPVRPPAQIRFWRVGQYGVDLFFVLSGWLIGSLYWKERARFGDVELLRFWLRRWIRTVPPYLGALVVTWLAVSFDRGEPFNWSYLFFLQNYHPRLEFFSVSWSLCIEEHFYLFLPLLLVLGARSRWSVAILFSTLIIAAPVCRWGESPGGMFPQFGYAQTATHLRMEGLLLGFWAAYLANILPGRWPSVRKASLWVATASTVMLAALAFLPRVWMYRLGLTILAIGFCAVLVFLTGRPAGAWVGSRIIKAIALSSYSVYLTHALVLRFARRSIEAIPALPWPLYFPLALGMVTVMGAIFYLCIERVSIQFRDRWIPRRTATRGGESSEVCALGKC